MPILFKAKIFQSVDFQSWSQRVVAYVATSFGNGANMNTFGHNVVNIVNQAVGDSLDMFKQKIAADADSNRALIVNLLRESKEEMSKLISMTTNANQKQPHLSPLHHYLGSYPYPPLHPSPYLHHPTHAFTVGCQSQQQPLPPQTHSTRDSNIEVCKPLEARTDVPPNEIKKSLAKILNGIEVHLVVDDMSLSSHEDVLKKISALGEKALGMTFFIEKKGKKVTIRTDYSIVSDTVPGIHNEWFNGVDGKPSIEDLNCSLGDG